MLTHQGQCGSAIDSLWRFLSSAVYPRLDTEPKAPFWSHLWPLSDHTSLTFKLATNKALLDEMRTLREADKNTDQQRVRAVDLCRCEVKNVVQTRKLTQ